MGTASFVITRYAPSRGQAAALGSTYVRTSGAYTTSTTASALEDDSGDITISQGEIIRIYADVAMRLAFDGVTATASVGHYIPSGQSIELESESTGTISIRDVA